MPTIRGPITLGGNKPIPDEIRKEIKLPFQADNAVFSAPPDLVKVESAGLTGEKPKAEPKKVEPAPKAEAKSAPKKVAKPAPKKKAKGK